jgi:hypothetical protein
MLRNIFNITKLAFGKKTVPVSLLKQAPALHFKLNYLFTSTSNPSQVALM